MAELARVKTILTGFTGAPGVMTVHFRKRTGLAWSTYGDDMVNRVQTFWEDFGGNLSDQVTYRTLGAIDILDEDTGAIVSTLGGTDGSVTGTGPGNLAPIAAGVCVTWNTIGIVNGKHVRGRTFVVPVCAITGDPDGTLTTTTIAVATSAANGFVGSGAEAVVPVIYSRPIHATLSGPTARLGSMWDITSHNVKDKYAVLRSRRD